MESKSKMVILMRTDLNMRKGKMVAMGSHASLKLILDLMADGRINTEKEKEYSIIITKGSRSLMDDWLNGIFTKICLQVDSEQELIHLINRAKANFLYTSLIEDNGLTEFHGVKTITCGAILGWNENVNEITGHLKLL